MKRCFSTLGCTEYSLEQALALANRFGVTALEVRGLQGELDNARIAAFAPDRIDRTAEAFRNAGVIPLILGTSCAFHEENKAADALREGFLSVELAARVGFRAIRVFGNRIVGEERSCIDRVADGIGRLCAYAKEQNVDVLLETHGDFNTEARLRAVCDRCGGRDNFGLIWDVCHTHATYGDRWTEFCDRFVPYIRHVHLKDIDGRNNVLPGTGILPLPEMADYLVGLGYEGYFSLEWERKWHPDLPPVEQALQALFFDTLNTEEGI